ncbi:MAG: NAD(P)-dependent oxidoreductase [Coriobacteriia bacterium]|nr:NAD(P)-dependent oxidoreductase [Coriobacteriia bacterium]
MPKEIKKVGFIGTGIMGSRMASNLMNGGYELVVFNRSKEKAQALLDKGAHWAQNPREVIENCEVVFTILGYPEDVEEVYLGENGLIEYAQAGQYLIDMTTSDPILAQELYQAAAIRDVIAFDAPVTGGDTGAKAGTLTIMCGASEETVAPVLPLLQRMGTKILYFGKAGDGMLAKLTNQIALASNMVGMAESLAFAKQAGLDTDTVFDMLTSGFANSQALSSLGAQTIKDNYEPGFMVEHLLKDIGLALSSAEHLDLSIPGTENAYHLYDLLVNLGASHKGTQCLRLLYAPEDEGKAHGVNWELLDEAYDEQFEDEHHHGHRHEHHHEHDEESLSDYPYFGDDDYYHNN